MKFIRLFYFNALKKILIVLFIYLFISNLSAQTNLVPNSSFENYTSCPSTTGEIQKAYPWFTPHFNNSTEDYFNKCDTFDILASVPRNGFGYQYAHTGDAYAGISLYDDSKPNYREYIEAPLLVPLTAGKKYCVEFYVASGNTTLISYIIDAIGAYLSKDSIIDTTYKVLPYVSQINNPAGNVISDTLNWVKISGEFIAEGGEKFITIGNFKDDAHTNAVYTSGETWGFAYYYIDDVSVTLSSDSKSCGTGVDDNTEVKQKITVFPNPAKDELFIEFEGTVPDNTSFEVYNMLGNLVQKIILTPVNNKIQVSTAELRDGIYFYKITGGNAVIESDKLIIIK